MYGLSYTAIWLRSGPCTTLDEAWTIESTDMFVCAVRLSHLSAGSAVKRRQSFAWHEMVLEVRELIGLDAQATRVQP